MTMHMAHPALTMGGKKKGKVKFRNADEARKARALAEDWAALQKKWGVEAADKKRKQALKAEPLTYKLTAPAGRGNANHLPSRVTEGHSTAAVHKVYTGTKVLGIATMHKSNMVPVFSQEDAEAIAKMRRG